MDEKKISRKKYKKNFIQSVTFRMSYPKILELEEGKPSKLQTKIINEFPMVKERHGAKLGIEPDDKKEDITIKKEEKIGWEFINKDKTRKLFIESEIFELEFKKYSNFKEYFEVLKNVFDIFINLYPVKITKSLSLRYINIIELDEKNTYDWSEYINSSLFSIPKEFFKKESRLLGYLNLMEFKEDECNIDFNYGLYNSEYPNPINRKEFLLDYECHLDEDVEISRVLDKIKKFHEIEDKWFEISILDKLREKMEVEK